jgi:DNA-binding MarR family transcriptional regulator
MADINVSKTAVAGAGLAERRSASGAAAEPIWDIIELLFFAVNRNPGMKVADLLEILNITKQSLGRVLKQLVDQGYVLQKEGEQDRRQRLLYVTPKGEALALRLATLQTQRINRAFSELGPNAHDAARRFLTSMIDADNRDDVLRLIGRAERASRTRG